MPFVYCQGSDQENKTIIRVRDGTCRHGFFWMNLGMALHAFPHKNVITVGAFPHISVENVKAKSLYTFINHDFASYHLKGIRFSMLGFQEQGWMENVPLFAAREYISRNRETPMLK